ncbi:MAG TPA: DUF1566 domain-containing protein [Gammaproteobacteria bacterium]|nr:DUF1566 domain-containing protein [Gammaproteobacteria bacterium]
MIWKARLNKLQKFFWSFTCILLAGLLVSCGGGGKSDAPEAIYYEDSDQDGYGNPNRSLLATAQPAGYVLNPGDCDDGDAEIHPEATEILDGFDNNCDGQVDEGLTSRLPVLSISDASTAEGDAGSGELVFTVSMSAPSSSNVTVDFSTSDNSPDANSASSGVDYIESTGTLTIPAGNTSGTIQISVIGDTQVELNESFMIKLSNPVGAVLSRSSAFGTILNDDSAAPTATIYISDSSVREGDDGVTALDFHVVVSPSPDKDVTFRYVTADGTATSESDYSPASGTVSIPAGSSNATISIDIVGDMLLEGDEVVTLVLSDPSGAALNTSQVKGVIINDDGDAPALPVVKIANNIFYSNEGSGIPLGFVISVPVSAHDISVEYETSDISAKAGSDYVAASGTVTIPAGASNQIIYIDILDDSVVEGDEAFSLSLKNPVGAHLSAGSRASVGIIRNDDSVPTLPMLDILDASALEGDSGNRIMRFEARLSRDGAFVTALNDVTVDFATSDASAISGSDYIATTGTFVFPAGFAKAFISVELIGDVVEEGSETLKLALSNPSSGVMLGRSMATGTIIDDDQPFVASLNDTGVTSCSDSENDNLVCAGEGLANQDATVGRDAVHNDNGDGHAGYSFTKLDSNGQALVDQGTDYSDTPWACVKDNVTGLVWEVRTDDDGLRDRDWTYSWYKSTGINDGGDAGTSNGGFCVDSANCDTEKYVIAVNATALCGFTDWRLPSVEELMGLRDDSLRKSIDSVYFPDLPVLEGYWTSSPVAYGDKQVWAIEFNYSRMLPKSKTANLRVRLVRGGN